MDAPQPQRTRILADSAYDYITNLPANVKDNIFLKLPIQEVVRTSILSSKWIDAWVLLPNLVFEQNNNYTKSVFITMVDRVLLAHRGPIKKFKLLSCHTCNKAIGRWLLILSTKGIKDLHLQFGFSTVGKIPFRLISCIVLERLSLFNCRINIPSFFQGFKQLRTLSFSFCTISGISIENMVLSCPLLDYLRLDHVNPLLGCLRICASNLTCLEILDQFHDICLETPKLAYADIYLITPEAHLDFNVAKDRKESNITSALGCLSNIQNLKLTGAFIQYLAAGPIPENLPAMFNHLADIKVSLYVKPNEISAVFACLKMHQTWKNFI